jgi:hypothetical protein
VDPETTLALWREAIDAGNFDDAALEYGPMLREWLRRGGFEPSWAPGEREVFFPAKERLRG